MNALPTVAVLMSTYNGEAFVKEQMDSILSQANVSVRLYARDDGSTDSTVGILQHYQDGDSRVQIVLSDENLGPACSFMELLYYASEHSDADYFAFADQDDVWKPGKLERALSLIGDREGPALYCSNQTLFDGETELGLRYSEEMILTVNKVLFANHIAGCTMVLNRKLAEIASAEQSRPTPSVLGMRMHDTWILLVALLLGSVVYDCESCIDYRIHKGNCVGVENDDASPLKRITLGFTALGHNDDLNYRSKYAAELISCFPWLNQQSRKQLEELAFYKQSVKSKARLLFDGEMRTSSGEPIAAYVAKVLMGTY